MGWKDELKAQWRENPIAVIGAGAIVATAAAKVVESLAGARSKNAFARRENRKLKYRRRYPYGR